jgi:hypothetical protein
MLTGDRRTFRELIRRVVARLTVGQRQAGARYEPKSEADVLAENADLGGFIFAAVGCRDRPRRVYRGSYPLGVAEAGYPGYSNAGRDAPLRQDALRCSLCPCEKMSGRGQIAR